MNIFNVLRHILTSALGLFMLFYCMPCEAAGGGASPQGTANEKRMAFHFESLAKDPVFGWVITYSNEAGKKVIFRHCNTLHGANVGDMNVEERDNGSSLLNVPLLPVNLQGKGGQSYAFVVKMELPVLYENSERTFPLNGLDNLAIKGNKNIWEREDPESLEKFGGKLKKTDHDGSYQFSLKREWSTVVSGVDVLMLKLGHAGRILIGTRSQGLLIWDEEKKGRIIRMDQNTTRGALPSNTVTAAADDGKELWIGTPQGIIHTDGKEFKKLEAALGYVQENIITDISFGQNNVFIGTTMGLTTYSNSGNFNQYNEENGELPNNQINNIVTHRTMTGRELVILGTKKGAYEFLVNSCRGWGNELSGAWVNDICVDASKGGGIYFAFSGGIIRYPFAEETLAVSYSPEIFNADSGLPENWIKSVGVEAYLDEVTSELKRTVWATGLQRLFSNDDGQGWLETDRKANRIPGNTFRFARVYNGESDSTMDNRVYVATDRGVSVLKTVSKMSNAFLPKTKVGLPPGFLVTKMVKFKNSIWLATNKGAVNMSEFLVFNSNHWPIRNDEFNTVENIDDRILLAGPKGDGVLAYYGPDRVSVFSGESAGYPDDNFTAFEYDEADDMVIAACGNSGPIQERMIMFSSNAPAAWFYLEGEMNKPPENREIISDARIISCGRITAILKHDENVYIGTEDEGFFVKNEKGWIQYKSNPLAGHRFTAGSVRQIKADSFHQVWFATEKGLFKLSNGAFEVIKCATDMGITYDDVVSFDIQDDKLYRIWYAGKSYMDDIGGLVNYDSQQWHTYARNDIRQILFEGGYLWIYIQSDCAIYRVNATSFKGLW